MLSDKRLAIIKRLFNLANFVVLVGSWVLLLSGEAHAWGPGIHITKGSYILENLHLILPSIAQILRACPRDFLYGCISADFFIGKGCRRRDDHCHNWSVGLKMLANAKSQPNKAYISDVSYEDTTFILLETNFKYLFKSRYKMRSQPFFNMLRKHFKILLIFFWENHLFDLRPS